MIKYGLKLWSNNQPLFEEAIERCEAREIDFIELYNNPDVPHDYQALERLKQGCLVTIHNTHSHGFHEFDLGEEQLAIWKSTYKLADFFESPWIVVHPGTAENAGHFEENLSKIDDPRILIENMAGLDIWGAPMFGQKLEDLKKINAQKPLCFDFEKAVKAACYQSIDYKIYIQDALEALAPIYFHISGGDTQNPQDEHKNVWESNMDFEWIKEQLEALAVEKDVFLVFEVPKGEKGLDNDLKNIRAFQLGDQ